MIRWKSRYLVPFKSDGSYGEAERQESVEITDRAPVSVKE